MFDGFEPSGRMYIAQDIMKSINVNKITKAGGIFIFWVAIQLKPQQKSFLNICGRLVCSTKQQDGRKP